tara:strand:- start:431 stop:592 length:162 start_codon:yes stop_codon:yes gene_type:complete
LVFVNIFHIHEETLIRAIIKIIATKYFVNSKKNKIYDCTISKVLKKKLKSRIV